MKKLIFALILSYCPIFPTYSQSNREVLNRLDDLEYDQQMRDIQRRAEQQIILIPAPAVAIGSKKSELSFIKEVKTHPDRFRFIERVNPFDYYVYLPVKRWPDDKVSLMTVLLSDEVLMIGTAKYTYIVANASLDCKNKSVKISDGDAYGSNGSLVAAVQGMKISYGRSTKVWQKIDSLYCN